MKEKRYQAGGGIVMNKGKLLVLFRPNRNEIRLPKGHIDPGESAQEAALREVEEESGLSGLEIIADLGTQVVEFDSFGFHFNRTEYYYLMKLSDDSTRGKPEDQFEPRWVSPEKALELLTYEPEKEWVRRAMPFINQKDG
jgi:8-oxo-dGTP pyrophosphatase MutT (NUDIX family)